MTRHTFSIEIPTDENGFLGRECLECKRYFKLKPGTGLPTKYCHCPYCDYEGEQDTFWTPEQIEYARSVGKKIAYEQLIDPLLDDLFKSFKSLERSSRKGFIKFKVSQQRNRPFFPIKYYNEKELETHITCDNCELDFAIYGVFSRCPDCKRINAFSVFKKSLEVSKKQFLLFQEFHNDEDVVQTNLRFILSNVISSFDGLGKELRKQFSSLFPKRPKNLFQNLDELTKVLNENLSLDLSTALTNFEFIRLMFQVRHINEHNMGVIDDDFIKKIPSFFELRGRKYFLKMDDIEHFIEQMELLSEKIEIEIKKHHT